MTYPLISVIVPVYKTEKYLDKCVQSIVDQTYKNLEIILVDDGSPDNCPQMCDDWAKKDSRIKVIHKENGGASSARNAGLDAATGDFVGFVDGDDYISAEMYSELYSLIVEYKADAAACAIIRESPNGYAEDWSDGSIRVFCHADLLKWIGEAAGFLPIHLGNKLFSKHCVFNVRFDEKLKYAEDTLFNFEAACNMNKLVLKSEPYYHYINNAASVSHIEFDENRFDEHIVMDKIFSLAKGDAAVLAYCVKGDVLKSFRTIKRMCVSGKCLDRFKEIRQRILSHKKEILCSGIYGKGTKLKTVLLFAVPRFYKIIIRVCGRYANKKYQKLTEKRK